jgi:hypothetical protein
MNAAAAEPAARRRKRPLRAPPRRSVASARANGIVPANPWKSFAFVPKNDTTVRVAEERQVEEGEGQQRRR